jgi:hypothetical protein
MHTHPCTTCKTPVECDGTYERNYDGWPEAVCDQYHQLVTPARWLCLSCVMQMDQQEKADREHRLELLWLCLTLEERVIADATVDAYGSERDKFYARLSPEARSYVDLYLAG